MITIVSMSRRPQLYKSFVEMTEKSIGELVDFYYVFVNDPVVVQEYKDLEASNQKVKIFVGSEDFVYKNGHDTVYNFLEKQVKSEYIAKLFDTDVVHVSLENFKSELSESKDVYGIPTYMERGDVWETKYQLYKKGVLTWYGEVHENQHFLKQNPAVKDLHSLRVFHNNALDQESQELLKDKDGFIILKETQEGSDSDQRNMLYEYLTWKIVHENGRQDHLAWFRAHYAKNQRIVDWYYKRAKEKYKL